MTFIMKYNLYIIFIFSNYFKSLRRYKNVKLVKCQWKQALATFEHNPQLLFVSRNLINMIKEFHMYESFGFHQNSPLFPWTNKL